jgi:hypothetical protein
MSSIVADVFRFWAVASGDGSMPSSELVELEHRLVTPVSGRRSFARVETDLPAEFSLDGIWSPGRLRDLGAGGFSARVDRPPSRGEIVSARLLSDDHVYTFPGQLRWSQGTRIGCALIGVPSRRPGPSADAATPRPPASSRPTADGRTQPRERLLRLRVNARTIQTFARQYAANSIFIGGARDVEVGQHVKLVIEFEGDRSILATARVAARISAQLSEHQRPGLSLAIVEAPTELDEVVSSYGAR